MNRGGGLTQPTILNFDGMCEPNPGGLATYAYLISRDGVTLHKGAGVAKRGQGATNNLAEYFALGFGLKTLCEANTDVSGGLVIRGDSKLVIYQMCGDWQVKAGNLVPLWKRCHERVAQLACAVEWQHIPREENHAADRAARIALRMARREGVPMADEALNVCFVPGDMPPRPSGYRAVSKGAGLPVDLARQASRYETRMGIQFGSPFWVDKTGWTRADYFEHLARMKRALERS